MIKNLKIYYINLDRSPQRKSFMENQFSKLGLNATRINAVDGKELPKDEVDEIIERLKVKNEHYTLPNLGEIGVYMSHKKAWELIVNQEEDFALVLEDDALIDNKLLKDIDNILSLVSKNEIVDISGIPGFYKKEIRDISNIEIINYLTPSLMVISNIIGKDCANILLKTFDKYTVPVDNMLQQVYKHNIKIWISKHKYVTSNYKQLGGSTIQKTKKTSLKDKLRKELFRPIYRVKTHILNYTL